MGFKKLGRNVQISDRAVFHNTDQIEIGDHTRIDDLCVISGRVVLGRNVHIAVFVNLAGSTAGVFVEDFAGISYGSHVFSQSDDYSGGHLTGPTVPAKYVHTSRQAVHIGRHSIAGAGCVILPGVTLGEGTSLGAGSLVMKSTEPWSVYVGSPARRIKARSRELLKLEAAYLADEAAGR
jgi:acetyltransferase-like isoleucine patch superfamily enzyme